MRLDVGVQPIDMILQLPAGALEGIVDSNARLVCRFAARSLMCIKHQESKAARRDSIASSELRRKSMVSCENVKSGTIDQNQSRMLAKPYQTVSATHRWRTNMAETKVPVTRTSKEASPAAPQAWQPFDSLKREIDRLFDDFGSGFFRRPFRTFADLEPFSRTIALAPAVDVSEGEKAYEITAELPGIDEKNIEVKLVNGGLTIKGEKKEEKEEKTRDRHVSERRYGSFERYFRLPDGVDANKIEAKFSKGVLTVTLPKKPEVQQPARTIEVKSAA